MANNLHQNHSVLPLQKDNGPHRRWFRTSSSNTLKFVFFLVVIGFLGFILCVKFLFNLEASKSLLQPEIQGNFPLHKLWSFKTDEGNIISLATADNVTIIGTQNMIYAIDIFSGSLLWKKHVPLIDTPSSIFVSDNKVYVANSHKVYALEISEGKVIWETLLNSSGEGLIVADSQGYIFVVQISWKVGIYEKTTGDLIWDIPIGRGKADVYVDSNDQNIVYILDEKQLSAFDEHTGKLIWERTLGLYGPNAYRSGMIYFGLIDNMESRTLVAYDVKGKTEIWRVTIPEKINNLITDNEHIYINTDSGILAMDAGNGQRLWKANLKINYFQLPIVFDKVVFMRGALDSSIYAINADNGINLGKVVFGSHSFIMKSNGGYMLANKTNKSILIFTIRDYLYEFGN